MRRSEWHWSRIQTLIGTICISAGFLFDPTTLEAVFTFLPELNPSVAHFLKAIGALLAIFGQRLHGNRETRAKARARKARAERGH